MHTLSFSPLTALDIGPPELIDFVADAGFTTTGLRLHPAMKGGIAYPMAPGSTVLRHTRERMHSRGVRVLDIEVLLIDAQTDVRDFLPCIEAGAELGASRLGVNGEDPQLERFTENYARLCDLARPYGMEVDLEFMVWRPVSNLGIATKIVRDTGRANGKLLIDALHLIRSGGTVAQVAALPPALIGAVQICDGPLHGPDPQDTAAILAEARSGRLPPLEGKLPLVDLIRAIPAATPVSVEVPMAAEARFANIAQRVAHIRASAGQCLDMALMQ